MKLAPIVLFTYNRPWHTQQTIEALQKNELAKESELFIFSDGGKDEASWKKVNEVREYLKTINSFKKVILTFQDKNIGLADSIISGVTKIVNQYGKIIVLEDDHVTNKFFLKFMNDALDFYENEERIWQISGYMFPIEKESLPDIIFHQVMNCWGWGTWKNKWKYFEKDTQKLIDTYTKEDIKKFNLNNTNDIWIQVLLNYRKIFNTWAVFWHEVIFRNNGLYVNPKSSLINNIGMDSSGVHHGSTNHYYNDIHTLEYNIKFEKNIKENIIATDRIKLFYISINNKNMVFSKNINRLFEFLKNLNSRDENYILYGAGTGMDLVSDKLNKSKILFTIDKDENKHNIIKNDIKIVSISNFTKYDDNKTKIIITVFGREEEISNLLLNSYNVEKDRLILLDLTL
ncbi:glycosyltransferase [Aliarcobacter skirrowii]|uniref:Glycosyltransferase, family 2 n=1 Tax=Aliarcobacter skirrowii CCUG 10374 TaxID=1032239 RepID=A0AAD0SP35_9BACT|nr:glycosyltransferase [Aliarcobacter skirrowii]AXX85666.1 glycosyltransferase, family 2 [Aliarcobacter skirrowii CCUG 10374]KAB0620928.1 glycosyltransferase [Aliarcobacter skirrowii CCUG 10374]SUU95798.1 Uncharacterised protein [Aliarcobacter skirrowii]